MPDAGLRRLTPERGRVASPQNPSQPRRPNSLRRTSSIDILCDESGAELRLIGLGRDLLTDDRGESAEIARAATAVAIELAGRTVSALSVEPLAGQHLTAALVGIPASSGFRAALRRCAPDLVSSGSLLGLLLDEVPVAMIIAGSLFRRRPASRTGRQIMVPSIDVCAGWVAEGVLATSVRETGLPASGDGPIVASLTSDADQGGWHALPPLPPWSMRRARRLDLWRSGPTGDTYELEAFFRDSRVLGDGIERGVHEYHIRAGIDGHGNVQRIEAVPHVLPAPECPAAAASAQRLVGVNLGGLRDRVAATFTGTTTCTHLNDTMRSLGDLAPMLSLLTRDRRRS